MKIVYLRSYIKMIEFMYRVIKVYLLNICLCKNKMIVQYMYWNMYVIYLLYCKEELCNKYLVFDKY